MSATAAGDAGRFESGELVINGYIKRQEGSGSGLASRDEYDL